MKRTRVRNPKTPYIDARNGQRLNPDLLPDDCLVVPQLTLFGSFDWIVFKSKKALQSKKNL